MNRDYKAGSNYDYPLSLSISPLLSGDSPWIMALLAHETARSTSPHINI
jgi:hypothetical protein